MQRTQMTASGWGVQKAGEAKASPLQKQIQEQIQEQRRSEGLDVEGSEGDALGSDEEFAVEGGIGGAAAEGLGGGEVDEVGVVIFLGDVSEDEEAGAGVEAFGVGEIFADGEIGKVAGAAEDALLDDPGVGADFEHVQIVIGFEDEAIGVAEMDFDVIGHVAEVGDESELGAVGAEGEADGVGGVVRNGEGADFDIADGEALAGSDGFASGEALAEGVGKNALESVEGGVGDEERCFPEREGLGKAAAVVGVLMRDEDAVEAVDVELQGGEAGEGVALAEAGVDEEAGARGFEQGDVARAAGRQNGNAQADRCLRENEKTNFKNDGREGKRRQRGNDISSGG